MLEALTHVGVAGAGNDYHRMQISAIFRVPEKAKTKNVAEENLPSLLSENVGD